MRIGLGMFLSDVVSVGVRIRVGVRVDVRVRVAFCSFIFRFTEYIDTASFSTRCERVDVSVRVRVSIRCQDYDFGLA